MRRRCEIYLTSRTAEEKAAALDAAIEYEDTVLQPDSDNSGLNFEFCNLHFEFLVKGMAMMITKDQWLRFDASAAALRKANENFRAICRELGGDEESPDARDAATNQADPAPLPQPPAAISPPAPTTTRRANPRAGPGAKSYASGKSHYHPGIRIQCLSCGGIVEGASQKGDKYFPYRHPNRETDGPCGGNKVPGRRVDPDPMPNPE
jgi:hypothetical protein